MRYLPSCLLIAVSLLTACGGGNDSSTVKVERHNISAAETQSTVDTFFITNQLLSVAYGVKQSLLFNAQINDKVLECNNGGYASYHFSSTSNQVLAVGETLQIDFANCDSAAFSQLLDGRLIVTVEQRGGTDLSVMVDAQGVEFDDGERWQMKGDIGINLSETSNLSSSITLNTDSLEVTRNGSPQFQLTNLNLQRSKDMNTARYQLSARGKLENLENGSVLNISTAKTLQGYLGEYPYEGRLLLQMADGTPVKLSAHNDKQSNAYTLDNSFEKTLQLWSNTATQSYWSFDDKTSTEGEAYDEDNFRYLGAYYQNHGDHFSTLGQLAFIFSRPVKTIASSEYDTFFFRDIMLFANIGAIPATARVQGATVTLTAAQPLIAGIDVVNNYFTAYDDNDASVLVGTERLQVEDVAQLELHASSPFYRAGDLPKLTTELHFNQGSAQQYQWHELSQTGISFTAPNSPETSFSMQNNNAEQVTVMLEATNEFGQVARKMVSFYPLATNAVMAFAGEAGDYISQGRKVVIDQTMGHFHSYDNYNRQRVFDYQGEHSWWTLTIEPPIGQLLHTGSYPEVRISSTSALPSLSFDGEGRGCGSKIVGYFNILEWELQDNVVTKAAINFSQKCDGNYAPLRGIVRYNSNVPLN
ncbi:hypothetical protein HR45_01260 [Shewanella mangrovi]|uniref:Uncharacterized protein n=1 Tax=Shewanella mangrovi TaxID=1515746 RepID=A0A094JGI0_9GAMM|nr:hypothetical protein [Shewanella mangrovi]KFZ39055.1 hypothetical protein HR45_01260 [Shewanella mangrovi]